MFSLDEKDEVGVLNEPRHVALKRTNATEGGEAVGQNKVRILRLFKVR